jgi:enoyl-[acyl-carrier protein] reductase/trans-2-enoyl-CoA reductase (NAD+)
MLKDYSIIKPKTRSFISFNAHSKGLKNKINLNIKFIRKYFLNYNLRQYKNILVLGSSTGYGLSTSLTAYFSLKPFNIINVFFDRKSKGTKTASSGWYNMSHLSSKVNNNRTSVFFLNEDVFLNKTKRKVLKLLGILNIKLDLLVYSIAAPKRLDIRKNSSLSACLKPVIAKYEGKTINLDSGDVVSCILQIADFKEIYSTKYVMGGED